MRNFVHIIIAVILAVSVFFTGTGITVYKYCCSNCKISYSILAQKHGCSNTDYSETDQKDADHNCSGCVSHTKSVKEDPCKISDSQKCSIARISADINFQQVKSHINVPLAWVIIYTAYSRINTFAHQSILYIHSASSKAPPVCDINSYLALIQVFII